MSAIAVVTPWLAVYAFEILLIYIVALWLEKPADLILCAVALALGAFMSGMESIYTTSAGHSDICTMAAVGLGMFSLWCCVSYYIKAHYKEEREPHV